MLKEFPSQSGNASFTINSNDDWNYSPETTPEWLTVSISSGKLNVSVEANDAHRSRSFNLTVSNDCGLSIPLTIKQAAYTAPIVTCYTISEVSLSYSNVDADGGTATPTVSTPTVTAYYDNGTSETVTDAELVYEYTSGGGSGTIVTGKSIDNEDAGKITFGPNSDFSTKTRNVDLEVYVNRFKNACDGSVATASATCQQAARVAQITGYTIQITKFEYGSKVPAAEGTGTPTVNYTVTAKYDDGHTEDVTATKSVTKKFAKVGTGEGTVKTNGNVEYDKNEEEAERTTSVRLTIALADKPEVSASKDANCIQNAAEKPKVVEIDDIDLYVGETSAITVNPIDTSLSIDDETKGKINGSNINGRKIGTGEITGYYAGYENGTAQYTIKDKLIISERINSKDPNHRTIIIPWLNSQEAQSINTFSVTTKGGEFGNLTWTSNDSKIILDNSAQIVQEGQITIPYTITGSTTDNPDADFEAPYVEITVESDNKLIEPDVLHVIILPSPLESRYFVEVHDSAWDKDNYGPTEKFPSKMHMLKFGRLLSKAFSDRYGHIATEEEFYAKETWKSIYLSLINEVYRIDKYNVNGLDVYKGPYLQFRNTDNAARYNCQTCCGGMKYAWAVISENRTEPEWRVTGVNMSYISGDGSIGEYTVDTGTEDYKLNCGGMSDGDQSEGLTIRDVTGQPLVIEYLISTQYNSNTGMADETWFKGVGMTNRKPYTPSDIFNNMIIGKDSHYSTPTIWGSGGKITVPAGSYGKDSETGQTVDIEKYIISDKPLTEYKRLLPRYGLQLNVGQTKTLKFYSYECISKTNLIGGPGLISDVKGTDSNKVSVSTNGYDSSTHTMEVSLTGVSVGQTIWQIHQEGGDTIKYEITVNN